MSSTVLIVDDEQIIRNSLQRVIKELGHQTLIAANGAEALEKVMSYDIDIVFLDVRLPDLNGLEVLKQIREINQMAIVVVFSAYGTFKTVVEAMKLGAFDFLQKPYQNEEVGLILMKALERVKLAKEVCQLRATSNRIYKSKEIIAKSAVMRRVLDLALTASKSGDTPVLIEGETGVGKELIAHLVHTNSSRSKGPYIIFNCGAISKELMESEIFGYDKGAFTGALATGKPGMLELAGGGTLFLDEIGELRDNEQVKLLRVLEGQPYYRVGGVREKICDVRIISATNRDLDREQSLGNFRSDLYYRLNVLRIKVPPLRERKADIIPLSKAFIVDFNKKFGKNIKEISSGTEKKLLAYEWKGNVRELRNVIERAVLLSKRDCIDMEDLMLNIKLAHPKNRLEIELEDGKMYIDDIDKIVIKKALEFSNGSISGAARLLGLKRGALRYRLRKYNLENGISAVA